MRPVKEYRNCTILYVDDEEKSLKYFERAFQHRFNILSADNAADAYRLLLQHQQQIAVLLTDQRMPGEKGIEFLQRARRLHPAAVRILTTAYSDFDVIIEAINSSSIAKYITKPWDLPQLEDTLKGACEVYLEHRAREDREEHQRSSAATLTAGGNENVAPYLETLDDVAHYLNVDKFTVYRLVTRNKLPAFKVGNQWRFKRELIDAWLDGTSNIPKDKLV